MWHTRVFIFEKLITRLKARCPKIQQQSSCMQRKWRYSYITFQLKRLLLLQKRHAFHTIHGDITYSWRYIVEVQLFSMRLVLLNNALKTWPWWCLYQESSTTQGTVYWNNALINNALINSALEEFAEMFHINTCWALFGWALEAFLGTDLKIFSLKM